MKKMGKRRLIAGILVLVMLTVPKVGAEATSDTREKLENAKEEREATENQKNAQEENITNMEEAQSGLEGELNSLNSQLAEVSSNLEEIENNIIAKNEEIETTQAELEEAKATEERQYLCLKKRIQYSYEKRSISYLEAILSADSLGEVLNMTEYFTQMASYDQEMLAPTPKGPSWDSFSVFTAVRSRAPARITKERCPHSAAFSQNSSGKSKSCPKSPRPITSIIRLSYSGPSFENP